MKEKKQIVFGVITLTLLAMFVWGFTSLSGPDGDGFTQVFAAPRTDSITITLSDYDYDKISVELPGHVWGEAKDVVNNTITIKISEYDKVVIISYLKLSGDRYTTIATELIEIQ